MDRESRNTAEETSQRGCSCNLSMAQIHILFEVLYYLVTEAFLSGAIFARPPLRSNAIYEDVCISEGVDSVKAL